MSKTRLCIISSFFVLFAIVAGAQQESALPQIEVPILPKSRATSVDAEASRTFGLPDAHKWCNNGPTMHQYGACERHLDVSG